MSVHQKIIKLITSEPLYRRIKSETQEWRLDCKCGYADNLWNYGGIRYKAKGSQWVLQKCHGCNRFRFLKMHK